MKNNKRRAEIKCGIYSVRCTITDRMYVGSSRNIKMRWGSHKTYLRSNEHDNKNLQEEWNKYGEDFFSFGILELCDTSILKEELVKTEQFYIDKYKATEIKIYNSIGAVAKESYYVPIPEKEQITIVIDTKNKTLLEYKNNLQVSTAVGIDSDRICEYCNFWKPSKQKGKKVISWNGLMFIRKEDFDPQFDYLNYKFNCWTMREKKPKPEKSLKAIADYDIKRVPVIAEHCITGEQKHFRSRSECCEGLTVSMSKLHKCLKAEFKKYKSKDHYFKFA